jgi:hypothetical protein
MEKQQQIKIFSLSYNNVFHGLLKDLLQKNNKVRSHRGQIF